MASRINTETLSSVNMLRRPSSPTVSRGRSVEPHGRGHLHFNGRNADMTEPSRSAVSDSMRLPAKALATVENGGIGRTISKKLLDMAIRNMVHLIFLPSDLFLLLVVKIMCSHQLTILP